MDIEFCRDYCLSKKGVTEDFPFDETTLCFRVGGKIFALTDTMSLPFQVNLKCLPEKAIELRERYNSIIPGWHMNKKHWNTIVCNSEIDIDLELFKELIDDSYSLVFNSLKKDIKNEILDL